MIYIQCRAQAWQKYSSQHFWKWRYFTCNYFILLNAESTNKSDDDSRDDEVETVGGDEVDSLAQAALEYYEV